MRAQCSSGAKTAALSTHERGDWRGGCTLSCCVVPIEDETDSEWDPDATDADTDVGTDNDPLLPLPLSPSAAAALAGSLTYLVTYLLVVND